METSVRCHASPLAGEETCRKKSGRHIDLKSAVGHTVVHDGTISLDTLTCLKSNHFTVPSPSHDSLSKDSLAGCPSQRRCHQTRASGEPVTLSVSITGLLSDQAIKEEMTGLLLGQRKGEDRASWLIKNVVRFVVFHDGTTRLPPKAHI
jgi:hypothetical protein